MQHAGLGTNCLYNMHKALGSISKNRTDPAYSSQALANQEKNSGSRSTSSLVHTGHWEYLQDTLWFTVRRATVSLVLCNTLSQAGVSHTAHLLQ